MFGRSPEGRTKQSERPQLGNSSHPNNNKPPAKLKRPGQTRSLPHPGSNERKETEILGDGRRATVIHNSDGTTSGAIIYPDGSIEDIIDEILDK